MDSFNEKNLYTGFSMFQQRGPDVSRFRQFLNLLGCIIVIPIYSYITGYTRHPLTLDILLTIFAAEYNRFVNEKRRRRLKASTQAVQDVEKASYLLTGTERATECMAAIVGYREDPELFARALDSYKTAAECRFVLVGVDGDETPDMEMVRVFQEVRNPTAIR
jgi:hyaluronan synthase